MKNPIAITLGDPAGIGPEIIAKAYRDAPEVMQGCFVVGDLATMRRAVQVVSVGQIPLPIALLDTPAEALRAPPRCVPLLQVGALAAPVPFGRLSASAGALAAECVVWAAQAALRGELAALVTAPLNKEAMALAGTAHTHYPGHTEMLQALALHVEQRLQRPVVLVTGAARAIRTIAWCSGGAQSYFEAAIAAGADAFITGEISEPQAHYARESGVAYLACGHHASERYGAPAVASHVAAQLGLVHEFIDIDNPA